METSNSWRDELADFLGDKLTPTMGEPSNASSPLLDGNEEDKESFKDQLAGFLKSWAELILEFSKGCRIMLKESALKENSFVSKNIVTPISNVLARFEFLNEYLPEDRDPAHAWTIISFVLILFLVVLGVTTKSDNMAPPLKKMHVHPPGANLTLLPDGRHIAYQEIGVPAAIARSTIICPHPFLSSRLAGVPGIAPSLVEEFDVRLITYDLPGFGESDPHPQRDLNSSCYDLLHLADSAGVTDNFWMLCYSTASMYCFSAMYYIPHKIAGVALIAPMINPYDPGMSKDEARGTWEGLLPRRKLLYFLAKRFPSSLSYFYRRSFLSGYHGYIDRWMSYSLGPKDQSLMERPVFEEFWHRDVEESTRQGSAKPFIEEAAMLVSNWGFGMHDLHAQKKCQNKGVIAWLKSFYNPEECQFEGFLGPVHLWQGTEDQVVPSIMTDYVARVLPRVVLHKLPNEGHFSCFFFCEHCHRQIFSTLFGPDMLPPHAPHDTEVDPAKEYNI